MKKKKETKTSTMLKKGKFTEGELKLYNLNQKEVDTILEYQVILPVLQQDNGDWINARVLHEQLQIGAQFTNWMKRRINKYNFDEDIDFVSFGKTVKDQNTYITSKEYSISIEMAKQLCRIETKNSNSSLILKYLYSISNKELFIKELPRFEIRFKELLDKIFDTLYIFIDQYSCCNNHYRIDFYCSKLNLAVEYDEEQHAYQKEEDKEREKEIHNELKCNFIRVDKGLEIEGINKIIKYIVTI